MPGSQARPKDKEFGFLLVLFAMLFEFGRPQDFLPPLKIIPPVNTRTSLPRARKNKHTPSQNVSFSPAN